MMQAFPLLATVKLFHNQITKIALDIFALNGLVTMQRTRVTFCYLSGNIVLNSRMMFLTI